jgi:NADP-dependent 3-hydroxy acid dehydrogenase YdfG
MSTNIEGKVVVITGGSSGLGESTARHLSELGATVVIGARRKDRLDAIVKDITAKGGKALAVTVDVTKREQVDALIQAALKAYGKVDVLVNNAGIMPIAPFAALKVDEWEKMIDINIKGVLRHSRSSAGIHQGQKRPLHQPVVGSWHQGLRSRRFGL